MPKTLPDEARHSIDRFINQLKQADGTKHLFNTDDRSLSVISRYFDGDALHLGESRIVSASFQYALIEQMQRHFLDTYPDEILDMLDAVRLMTIANTPAGMDWQVQNNHISDPDGNYTALSSKSALAFKGKDIVKENAFWASSLQFTTSKVQFDLHCDDITSCLLEKIKLEPEEFNFSNAIDYITKNLRTDFDLFGFTRSADSFFFIKNSIASALPAETSNWYDKVKIDYPAFCLTKDQEMAILKEKFSGSVINNADKPQPFMSPYSEDTGIAENLLIENSRDILLQDPAESLKMLLEKTQNEDKEQRNVFIAEKLGPILCARAEFLANMKGNFVYHAMNHLFCARYHEKNAFPFEETRRNSILYYMYQQCIEIGEENIDLDIAAIDQQTKFLKSYPAP